MKKKWVLFVSMALAALAGWAQDAATPGYAVSELSVSAFRKIIVNASIDVVLVQNDTLRKAYIEGDENRVPEIAITVSNGVLTVASRRSFSYRGKVQVTIAVKELAKLEINADAGIVSFSPLQSPRLDVNIAGYCDIHLKSTGKILLEAGDGYCIKYLNTSSKTRVAAVAESEG